MICDNTVLFNEHKFPSGRLVSDCELVFTDDDNNSRLYIDTSNHINKNGFDAIFLNFGACPPSDNDSDYWTNPEMEAVVVFKCSALFDGIRHMWFNPEEDDMLGYLYYPNMTEMAEVFTKLRELEVQHCSSPD